MLAVVSSTHSAHRCRPVRAFQQAQRRSLDNSSRAQRVRRGRRAALLTGGFWLEPDVKRVARGCLVALVGFAFVTVLCLRACGFDRRCITMSYPNH